ncbi:MAG TPA: hypothetical protein VJH34_04180 [archaeon]|nr:hypothetical protein [archaeon]
MGEGLGPSWGNPANAPRRVDPDFIDVYFELHKSDYNGKYATNYFGLMVRIGTSGTVQVADYVSKHKADGIEIAYKANSDLMSRQSKAEKRLSEFVGKGLRYEKQSTVKSSYKYSITFVQTESAKRHLSFTLKQLASSLKGLGYKEVNVDIYHLDQFIS